MRGEYAFLSRREAKEGKGDQEKAAVASELSLSFLAFFCHEYGVSSRADKYHHQAPHICE